MPIQSSPKPEAESPPSVSVDTPADTRTLIGSRLQDLRNEKAIGLDRLAQLQKKATELHATLLRIEGAITVLEELSGERRGPI